MQLKRIFLFSFLFFNANITLAAQDLLDTYVLALENDPTIKAAFANALAVGESKDQSIARMLPTVSASLSSSKNWLNNKKTFGDSSIVSGAGKQSYYNSRFSLNLTQPVFNYENWIQLSQSENQIAQAGAQYQAELQNLMQRTSEAYFNVLSAQDELEFRKAEEKSIGRQLEQAQQRFNVGLIAITDVYEAQAGYDQSRADVIAAENGVDNAKEQLREIIGEDNSVDLASLGGKLPLPEPNPADIEAWSRNATINNFNIIAAFNGVEVANKSISLQRSGHYPTLDIVGSYTITDNSATFGLRGEAQTIGLQLNVPLFEGGAVNSRTRQAQHEYTQAHDELIATKRAVNRQVKDAYRGVITSIGRVKALKAAVVSGQSSLEATEAGFDVGTRTMVDVLATTRNLFDAQSKYSRSRYDYIINNFLLKQAASSLSRDDLAAINGFLK
jgi:outer membrane protein